MHPIYSERIVEIIGKKLVSVLALIYIFDGNKNFENPLELEMHFSSKGRIRFACDADGASIRLVGEGLIAFDMGDQGTCVVEDVSSFPIWEKLLGKTLMGASFVKSAVEIRNIGVQLNFDDSKISILNLGDELYVYENIPKEVISDEGITLSKVE